jgi:hypothetical protein
MGTNTISISGYIHQGIEPCSLFISIKSCYEYISTLTIIITIGVITITIINST